MFYKYLVGWWRVWLRGDMNAGRGPGTAELKFSILIPGHPELAVTVLIWLVFWNISTQLPKLNTEICWSREWPGTIGIHCRLELRHWEWRKVRPGARGSRRAASPHTGRPGGHTAQPSNTGQGKGKRGKEEDGQIIDNSLRTLLTLNAMTCWPDVEGSLEPAAAAAVRLGGERAPHRWWGNNCCPLSSWPSHISIYQSGRLITR